MFLCAAVLQPLPACNSSKPLFCPSQGYLPESMFDRILTGPIVPEEVSRRGRRPKSTAAKAATASPVLPGNSLLANGLLPGMDLSSLQALQQNLQSLQALQLGAGLMGLPGGLATATGDTGNLASMFPMMLSNLLGMSSLLGKSQEVTTGAEDGKKESGNGNGDASVSSGPPVTPDPKGERTKGLDQEPCGSVPTQSAASASSSLLALNPLLLSSMLYPGMLLPPSLNLPQSPVTQSGLLERQQQSSISVPSSPAVPPEETPPEARGQGDRRGEGCGEQASELKKSGEERLGKSDSSSESGTSASSEDSDSSDGD